MRLGICSRYTQHEAAYCAILLADGAAARGVQVSLFPASRKLATIDRRWDAVVRANKTTAFSHWARAQDVILWTHCPHYEQFDWCRQQSLKTVVLSLWHELELAHRNVYRQAELVLSPSRIAAKLLQSRWQLSKSLPLPLDLNLPVYCKRGNAAASKLLLPLFDGVARRMQMTALEILDRVLATYPQLSLTVAYNSSTLASYAYLRLRRMQRAHGENRLQLAPGVPWHARPLLFQRHDLTIWPTQAENTGLVGLCSLAMGTPLACFAFPPLEEIATSENAWLSPCGLDYTQHGVPYCHPDYLAFEEMLHRGLKCQDSLRMLQKATSAGLARRREEFTNTLSRVIS